MNHGFIRRLANAMLTTIGDLDLKDEFALLPHNAVLADVAKALSPVKNSAALIRGAKGQGIAGIVKVQMLLQALGTASTQRGQEPAKSWGPIFCVFASICQWAWP